MSKQKKEQDEFSQLKLSILLVIIILIIYFFIKLKKQKEQELEHIKKKLEENEKLNNALQKRKRLYFTCIRWIFVLIYLGTNFYQYQFKSVGLDIILNINAAFFILASALTFARFGSFDSYHKWWSILEIGAEILIYKKSPELKKIIVEQQEYKKNLEKEIDHIDLFFNSISQSQKN